MKDQRRSTDQVGFCGLSITLTSNYVRKNFSTVSGDIENVVWPVMRDTDTPYIPPSSIYNRDGTQDTIEKNGENFIRIWNFDDTHNPGDTSAPCDGALVCTRPGSSQSEEVPTLSSIIDNRLEYKTFKTQSKEEDGITTKELYIASCVDTINPEKKLQLGQSRLK